VREPNKNWTKSFERRHPELRTGNTTMISASGWTQLFITSFFCLEYRSDADFLWCGTGLLKDLVMVIRLTPKSHRHGEVGVDLAILKVLSHQRHEDVDFLLLPAQSASKKCQAEAFEPFEAVDLVPATELLHEGVSGPAVGRPHEHALLNVDKTGFVHHVLILIADVGTHESACLSSGFAQ
jgi:hypothetical protein